MATALPASKVIKRIRTVRIRLVRCPMLIAVSSPKLNTVNWPLNTRLNNSASPMTGVMLKIFQSTPIRPPEVHIETSFEMRNQIAIPSAMAWKKNETAAPIRIRFKGDCPLLVALLRPYTNSIAKPAPTKQAMETSR